MTTKKMMLREYMKRYCASVIGSGDLRTPVPAGNYKLSIQASKTHYCTPRVSWLGEDDYQEYELAIFSKGMDWVVAETDPVIKAFPFWGQLYSYCDMPLGQYDEWDELTDEERAQKKADAKQVYGYVPYELLNELYLYLHDPKGYERRVETFALKHHKGDLSNMTLGEMIRLITKQ